MKISVIGCGYLGAVHAATMASLGHRVIGVDSDHTRVAQLASGTAPFYEPELEDLLRAGLESGLLSFTGNISQVAEADTHFVCVGTPQVRNGSAADLTYINSAVDALLPHLSSDSLVVGKSTVPVGTAAALAERLAPTGSLLAWNPEFLREGWAVKDSLEPDRIVFGLPPGEAGARASATLSAIYEAPLALGTPCIHTDYATAELVKVAANAFLATKISFINAMAEISEVVGGDVTVLADALGHDARIGRRYLGAGIGFGGGCLPKDIRAFAARAEELGLRDSVSFLREVDAINLRRRDHAVQLVVDALDGQPLGKRVAVLGAAFKPFSDDTRDSPALYAATQLHGLGADVVVTDPRAIENARRVHPQLRYEVSIDRALRDADAVLIATEWSEYRHELDPAHAAGLVTHPTIVDARNCLDLDAWRAAGWNVRSMGRP